MRDSGTTTKQLLEAPENSIYVWVNGKVDYPKRLAAHLGRDDIKIVPPSFIGDQKLRGRNNPIVLDHAVHLTPEQFKQYFLYANRNTMD